MRGKTRQNTEDKQTFGIFQISTYILLPLFTVSHPRSISIFRLERLREFQTFFPKVAIITKEFEPECLSPERQSSSVSV